MNNVLSELCGANLASSWPVIRIIIAKLLISNFSSDMAELLVYVAYLYFRGESKKMWEIYSQTPITQ